MIYLIMIFIIWTWDLTPLWVNVVVTVLASIALLSDDNKE